MAVEASHDVFNDVVKEDKLDNTDEHVQEGQVEVQLK